MSFWFIQYMFVIYSLERKAAFGFSKEKVIVEIWKFVCDKGNGTKLSVHEMKMIQDLLRRDKIRLIESKT